jgi:uncharacterized protein
MIIGQIEHLAIKGQQIEFVSRKQKKRDPKMERATSTSALDSTAKLGSPLAYMPVSPREIASSSIRRTASCSSLPKQQIKTAGPKSFQEVVRLLQSSRMYKKGHKYVIERLKSELPSNRVYHNIAHSYDVLNSSIRIALMHNQICSPGEELKAEDFILLCTTAITHDLGHIEAFAGHEEAGARIVEKDFGQFGYSSAQRRIIENGIRATKLPQNPKSLLEEIICDADVANKGRKDCFFAGIFVKSETENIQNQEIEPDNWIKGSIDYFLKLPFHTEAANKLYERGRLINLEIAAEILDQHMHSKTGASFRLAATKAYSALQRHGCEITPQAFMLLIRKHPSYKEQEDSLVISLELKKLAILNRICA